MLSCHKTTTTIGLITGRLFLPRTTALKIPVSQVGARKSVRHDQESYSVEWSEI